MVETSSFFFFLAQDDRSQAGFENLVENCKKNQPVNIGNMVNTRVDKPARNTVFLVILLGSLVRKPDLHHFLIYNHKSSKVLFESLNCIYKLSDLLHYTVKFC